MQCAIVCVCVKIRGTSMGVNFFLLQHECHESNFSFQFFGMARLNNKLKPFYWANTYLLFFLLTTDKIEQKQIIKTEKLNISSNCCKTMAMIERERTLRSLVN